MKVEYIFEPKRDRNPVIRISDRTRIKIREYVRQCSTEISWLGLVEQQEDIFFIEDVFLVPQTVTGATTNMEENAMFELANRFLREGREADLDKLRYWGHSHVNMSTAPSGTDVATLNAFSDAPYFIASIHNKSGACRFDIAFFDANVKYIEVPVEVPDDPYTALRKEVMEEISINVKKENIRSRGLPKTNILALQDVPNPKPSKPIKTEFERLSKKDRKRLKKVIADKPGADRVVLPSGMAVKRDTYGNWRDEVSNVIILSTYQEQRLIDDNIESLIQKQMEEGLLIQT